jgi:hypothetical protein
MDNFYRVGGVGVMGYISPMTTDDTYAVIDPLYGIDGFRNVGSIDDMLEISEERRRAGMIVGVNGGEFYYKLKNIDWTGEISDWDEVFFQTSLNNNITYVDKEIPVGVTNDDNKIFELISEPIDKSEHIYLNGLLQDAGEDYILDENYIIFIEPPMINSRIRCSYRTI